jgi:hypothetical protein
LAEAMACTGSVPLAWLTTASSTVAVSVTGVPAGTLALDTPIAVVSGPDGSRYGACRLRAA